MKSYKEYRRIAKEQQSATVDNQIEGLAEKMAAAYDGKSNMEMLKNILAEAEKKKREGKLSNEEIEMFYQSFSPMLNALQRKKLREIVERLKKI